jgi:aflatoxin B1 aldehyde reductase
MASQGIKVAFGTATFGNREGFNSDEDINGFLDILAKHNVKILDTAQLYGESEKRLGEVKAGSKFIIDTKWLGGWNEGWATKDNMVSSAKESIKKLGVDKVSSDMMP